MFTEIKSKTNCTLLKYKTKQNMTFSEITRLNCKCSVKTLSYVDVGQGADRGPRKQHLSRPLSPSRPEDSCSPPPARRSGEAALQSRRRLPGAESEKGGGAAGGSPTP